MKKFEILGYNIILLIFLIVRLNVSVLVFGELSKLVIEEGLKFGNKFGLRLVFSDFL